MKNEAWATAKTDGFVGKTVISQKRIAVGRQTQQLHLHTEITLSQQDEIEKYRRIESIKNGGDIGWERAAHEWSHKHFPEWKRHHWNRAVQDALRAEQQSAPFTG